MNTGFLDDMIFHDDDHTTWPAHLTTQAGKTLVINGRHETRKLTLRELLLKLDSYMETALSRRRDLVNLFILAYLLTKL